MLLVHIGSMIVVSLHEKKNRWVHFQSQGEFQPVPSIPFTRFVPQFLAALPTSFGQLHPLVLLPSRIDLANHSTTGHSTSHPSSTDSTHFVSSQPRCVTAFTGYQIQFLSKENAQAYPKIQEIKVWRGAIRKHSWK